ncbi:capsular polysaccharide synthesis protein [Brevibacterium sp. LE-L]|uniref:capsular polysaccharide synthesis protein n=1 Tax=Brevibacterium sp. LE-L TaxID=3418557 RepID=UPI003CF6236D
MRSHWHEILETRRRFEDTLLSIEHTDHSQSFIFWDKGFAKAPPLVQLCHSAWKRSIADASLIELDSSMVEDYVPIPPGAAAFSENHKAQYSDWLRFALIHSHGGAWIDATTYPGLGYTEFLLKLEDTPNDFFAPKRTDRPIATAFIWSRRGGYISGTMRAALQVYMLNYNSPFAYFQTHYIYAELVKSDPHFRSEHENSVFMDGMRWQRIWAIRKHGYEGQKNRIRSLLREFPVHKLSYKYDDSSVSRENVFGHFLSSGTLWPGRK